MIAGRHERSQLKIAFALLHNYFFLCKYFSFKSYLTYVAVCNIYVSAHVQNGLCKRHFERHFLVPLHCSLQLGLKVLFFCFCYVSGVSDQFLIVSLQRKNSGSPELEMVFCCHNCSNVL